MEKAKGIAKTGWHPAGKNGGKESWRGDNKGINQVAGWIGKGKDPHTAAQEHQSRPLATLKDPNAFGPPPKNVNYHGGAAVPNAITPDRRGLGAPISSQEILAKEAEEQKREEEAAKKRAVPSVPYRANTTGINTRNLPKPPVRRAGLDGDEPAVSPVSPKPKPSLPPRLPPRQNSRPNLHTPDPPPSYTTATQQQSSGQRDDLNAGALQRLGRAGVSVPSFGIGSRSQNADAEPEPANPWASESNGPPSSTISPPPTQTFSNAGLQSRFSKLSTTSSPPPNQGTTMQQKQDALRTASAFQKDPSSVSLSDARATASTANNFREKHGEQVTAGGKWAGAMNKRYDIAGRVNGYAGGGSGAPSSQVQPSQPAEINSSPWANEPSSGLGGRPSVSSNPSRDATQSPTTGASRKAPPPPPQAMKPGPPPVPLGSKPRA